MKIILSMLALALIAAATRNKDTECSARQLEGVWKLLSYRSSIKSSQEWAGLMFLDSGYFSRIYQESERRKLDFNFETSAQLTADQKDQIIGSFKQFRAGIGTYRVVGNTIIMKSTAIYNPNALGNEFSRDFRFDGKKLIFSGITKVAGDEVEEIWEPVD